jgi:hypothetical protein
VSKKAKPSKNLLPDKKNAPRKSGKRLPRPEDPEDVKQEPEQQELLSVPPAPSIQNGKMAVHFVKFSTDKTKNGKRIVNLDFSLELEDAHKGKLPAEVADAWKDLARGSIKRIDADDVGTQNVSLSLAPDGKVDLEIVAAVPKASISRITQKGKGKARKITRLSLRFLTDYTADVEHFCGMAFDETIWLALEDSQSSFGDDEGDEE